MVLQTDKKPLKIKEEKLNHHEGNLVVFEDETAEYSTSQSSDQVSDEQPLTR